VRILICGGRDFGNEAAELRAFAVAMIKLRARHPGITCVIDGGATGADTLARLWAETMKIPCETYEADWSMGNYAGPLRNGRMIKEGKPDAGVAFPGGRGTADMVRRLRAANIPVWIPYPKAGAFNQAIK
jgi:hypothetical protein